MTSNFEILIFQKWQQSRHNSCKILCRHFIRNLVFIAQNLKFHVEIGTRSKTRFSTTPILSLTKLLPAFMQCLCSSSKISSLKTRSWLASTVWTSLRFWRCKAIGLPQNLKFNWSKKNFTQKIDFASKSHPKPWNSFRIRNISIKIRHKIFFAQNHNVVFYYLGCQEFRRERLSYTTTSLQQLS